MAEHLELLSDTILMVTNVPFLQSVNQGEPGMEGEAGTNGMDGAKASLKPRHGRIH